MTRLPPTETVVVGAGVIGCAIAYELSRAGMSVALVDAGGVSSVASGASAGGVRQQGRDPRELPIAIRAIERWPHLTDELDADLHYYQDGHITLVEREEDLQVLEERVRREQLAGLDIRVVAGEELHALVPGLAPQIIAGSWCATDGHAMPIMVTQAYAQAAQRYGATIYEHTRVTGVSRDRDQVVGVETTGGSLHCNWLVNAAGIGSPDVARMVGVDLPIETLGLQMILTSPMSPRLRPVVGCVGRRLSLKQLRTGSYLIGGGWPGVVREDWTTARHLATSLAGSGRDSSAVYPVLNQASLLRSWIGLEAVTSDEIPIIGPVSGVEGFVLACGFSGHGFALAPEVGLLITQLIVTGTLPNVLQPLTLQRFLSTPSAIDATP